MVERPSRRGFLIGALMVPAAVLGARLAGAIARSSGAIRPRASGSSTTRCAQCGGTGHAMLDPTCPNAPRVTER